MVSALRAIAFHTLNMGGNGAVLKGDWLPVGLVSWMCFLLFFYRRSALPGVDNGALVRVLGQSSS